MELRNLNTFVRTAELHSFSKAAKQLGYSQSAVSMQISQLETELETRLFDRVGKTIALTPQGSLLYDYAQSILHMAEDARSTLKNSAQIAGTLRIAMAESICMSVFPDVLRRFCALYPDVQVTVSSPAGEDMLPALAQNEADLLFTLDSRLYQPDLVIPLAEQTPIVFVAAAEHPLAQRRRLPLEECLGWPFILTEKGMSYRSQLDSLLVKKGLEVRPFAEIGNTEIIAQLVAQGMGLSFLPEFVVRKRIECGEIVRLDVEGADITLWKQLIYHKGKWMTPAMQAMIDLIREQAEH